MPSRTHDLRDQPPLLEVSPSGAELLDLLPQAGSPRRVIGISGAPGSGKSTLAAYLASVLGERVAHVPMDGFHLADVELARQGLLRRKGAPETFDALGYAALLHRLRTDTGRTVYAPGFDRTLEQPLAGAIAVGPTSEVVLTEGNYLLLDTGEWREVHGELDEVWHVRVDEELRVQRLVERHVAFGKAPEAARAWVDDVDGPNARLVEASAHRADLVLDLTQWRPVVLQQDEARSASRSRDPALDRPGLLRGVRGEGL